MGPLGRAHTPTTCGLVPLLIIKARSREKEGEGEEGKSRGYIDHIPRAESYSHVSW